MEEYENIIKRIDDTYHVNLERTEKALLHIGINIRKSEKEYKSLPEVLEEISLQWEALSTEGNKFIKEATCIGVAGMRDKNFLIVVLDKMSESEKRIKRLLD